MVPFVRTRLALNDADLGLILLCLGGGAMLMMPVSGILVNRVGSKVTMLISALVLCAALPFLTVAPTPLLLAALLFVFGAGVGALDVSMNTQAVQVEHAYGRPIMSSLHGLYSVGGLVGASAVSFLLNRGLSPFACGLSVAVAGVLISLWQFRSLLPHTPEDRVEGAVLVWPRGPVLAIGLLCFITFLAEGALLDWSAVFFRVVRGFDAASAGLGYALFSLAMALGRLTGDRVVRRCGRVNTMRYGALLAGLGYFAFVFLPSGPGALAGCALIGLGVANVVPLLFTAAGRVPDVAPGVAIAAVTTLGYAGLLAGPAAIGFIGNAAGLAIALSLVGLALLGVSTQARIAARGGE